MVEQTILCVASLVLLSSLLLEPSELRLESGDPSRDSHQAFGERVAFRFHLSEPLRGMSRVLAHLARRPDDGPIAVTKTWVRFALDGPPGLATPEVRRTTRGHRPPEHRAGPAGPRRWLAHGAGLPVNYPR